VAGQPPGPPEQSRAAHLRLTPLAVTLTASEGGFHGR
jgi:hypothetical protein